MLRTHTCGQLNKKDAGEKVTLAGWVHRRRDHGGLIFIDLRDRYGLTQIVFNPDMNKEAWTVAEQARPEFVLRVTGVAQERAQEMVNEKMATGGVEVIAQTAAILNAAKTPPFEIDSDIDANEDLRLTYRYLDLRRERPKSNIKFRHHFIKFIRDYLDKENFLEVQTPILTKSTPEGARDYLVPSRVHKGKFYALPQSPQQYKQMLMVAGMDRYYQIAPCMRDEDARANRCPGEFYQLDLEMSFVEQEDVLHLMETMFTAAVEKLLPGKKIMVAPWPRLSYDEVKLKYGTDKPDVRFGLEMQDISELVKDCGFKVFADMVKGGGFVRALNAKGVGEKMGRSDIDRLTKLVKEHGAKGLAYIVVKEKELQSPIVKFLGDQLTHRILEAVGAVSGDIVFFGADMKLVVEEYMGQLRLELGRKLGLIDENLLAFAFVVDFPLFEEEKVGGHFAPSHHMFTAPKDEDVPLLASDPHKVRSWQHDMVLNGEEVGGGSIRIHDQKMQAKIFDLIGFSEKKKKEFDHILTAFQYGAPPHGGIAPGIDRFIQVLLGEDHIREVIAFPKNQKAQDLTMGAPSDVEEGQLKELGISIEVEEK